MPLMRLKTEASCFTSLCLYFLLYKIGMRIVLTPKVVSVLSDCIPLKCLELRLAHSKYLASGMVVVLLYLNT